MFTPVSFNTQDIVKDGLVLWLDANDKISYPGSGAVWKDLSGGGNNGTLVNGPTFDSGSGGSLVFDGVNDYVQLSSPITFNYNKTFSFWVNLGDIGESNCHILNLNTTNNYRNRVFISSNELVIYPSDSSEIITFTFSENILNKNKQIGFLTNNSDAYLIENGQISQQTPISFPNGNRIYQTLGAQSAGSSVLWYEGKINSFQYYNRALTSSEILQNYNATKSRFGLT